MPLSRLAVFVLLMSVTVLTSCNNRLVSPPPSSALSDKDFFPWISRTAANIGNVFTSPDLLPAARSAGITTLPFPSESLQGASSPSVFWKLHREKSYRVVLISAAAPFRPLALRLHSSPVWIMTDVSPWGYAFKPVSTQTNLLPWHLPTQNDLSARYPDPRLRSEWIAGTSFNLIVLGLLQEASDLLSTSPESKNPAVLEAKASLAAAKGRWKNAEDFARESVARDARRSSARSILVRALTESERTAEALEEAEELVSSREDQESLFLLARAAHVAGDRQAEVHALEKLVLLGRRDHQPLGASLTYLGQAYAGNGRRADALRTLEEALCSPELDDNERKAIRQLLDHLRPESPPPQS